MIHVSHQCSDPQKSDVDNVLRSSEQCVHVFLHVSGHTFPPSLQAQTTFELYGTMDPVTREWTDGMLSNTFRNMCQPLPAGKENERRWLVFDGDVDAVWIEDMNSVMDDNKTLTLPNSERIRLLDRHPAEHNHREDAQQPHLEE